MAEKGFGVKEINLIGASGTPTITSPNNINLNAANVAISTNVSIGGTLSVTGNVSVGGTLTYENVTNVDSVGVITAREHVVVGGGLSVVGISTLGDIVKIMSGLELQTNGTLDLLTSTSSSGIDIQSSSSVQISQNGFPNHEYARFTNTGVDLKYSNSTKLTTTNTGVTVTGTLAATAVTGDGSALTGIAVTEAPVTDYTITGSNPNYYFHGGGVDETAGNPDLYLIRGQKYRFNNTTGSGHPFKIRVSNGGTNYIDGLTGDDEGVQFFTVPYSAPASLVYQCEIHPGMVGNIYLRGAGGNETNVGVTTFSQTTSGVAGVTVTSQGLHHYEEGTFTPFLSATSSAPSITYGSERGGKYTRIGNIVFYSLGFQMTAFSGGSGEVYIGGFPYVGSGTPGWDGAHVFRDCSAIGLNSRTNTLGAWMEISPASGYPWLRLQTMSSTSNFGAGTIAPSSITTGRITVHGHYKVG